MNLAANISDDGFGPAVSAHLHGGRRGIVLGKRKVSQRLRLFSNGIHHGIACDANDFAQAGLSEEMEALPNRVLIWPELFGHCFANDGHLLCVFAICVSEFAA